jgi:hypothetical protein
MAVLQVLYGDFLFTPVLYQIVSLNRMYSVVNKYGL